MLAIKRYMQLNNVLAVVGFGLMFNLGAAMAANPVTATVSFNGEVTATNCVIVNGGAGVTVQLLPISVDELSKYPYPAQTGANTPIGKYTVPPITLTGCPASTKVKFGGGSDGLSSSITNTGTATGVTFSLKGNDNNFWLGHIYGMRLTATDNGNGNFTISGLTADYARTTASPPTAGSVIAIGLITVAPE